MIAVLIALAGGVVSALAFPRFGPGLLILPGLAMLLFALRRAETRWTGFLAGGGFGLVFITVLMWWSTELGFIALIPLVIVQALFFAWFGWWIVRYRDAPPFVWLGLVAGGWSLMELVRYRFPFSGLEWGGAGYALSEYGWARQIATVIGTSGWTIVVVVIAGAIVLAVTGRGLLPLALSVAIPVAAFAFVLLLSSSATVDSSEITVAIVQGSTPCPYEKCPPNERLGTYQQHLRLTETIHPGEADLVVWAEGSTGSSNADPVLNPEIGESIGAEARRIGAWFLVGGDRPVSESNWINANVVFNDQGEIVGEYRKQQGVPFGEYIPFRPLFDWIPALSQVPRDMVPGEGPEVFPIDGVTLGSVISFEGSFSRYARQHVNAGANTLVVATNEGSYGTTAVSDQLIGMTRMRAAELGVPVVHAAVTGKSVVIDQQGEFVSRFSGLGTQEIVVGPIGASGYTLYRTMGDWVMYLAVLIGVFLAWQHRRLLVSTT